MACIRPDQAGSAGPYFDRRACDKSRLDIAPGMGDAAIAFELKRQAYDADCPPNPSKRCKVAGPSEESFSNREIRENLSDKAAANASSSITCSAREQHEHDDQLRGLLALLKDSEQNIRKMRGACCTESEVLSNKCGSVLQDISKLQDLVSARCSLHGFSGTGRTGHAHPLCAQERFADLAWFRDVVTSIGTARDVVSNCKAELAGIQMHVHRKAAEREKKSMVVPSDIQDYDLVALVQRIAAVREAAAGLKQASEALQGPAHEAGGWACTAIKKLTEDMCTHDDALVAVREHAAKQFEAYGKGEISQGDKLLQEKEGSGVAEAFTRLLQAKAAYDEIHCLRPFSGQRAPELPYPDFSKELEKSENVNKQDKMALVLRLRDLAQEQMVLQSKLHDIQRKVSSSTRHLMSDQRCRDVWQLVDDLWNQSPGRHENLERSLAPALMKDTAQNEQARTSGKASVQDEAAQEIGGSAIDNDVVVSKLQTWMGDAARQLHVASLVRITEKLEPQLKQMEAERQQEVHLLKELQGGKHGQQNIHSSLDGQLKQFFADELSAIARRRASCAEVCSSIKSSLGENDVECDEVENAPGKDGKEAEDVIKSRGKETPSHRWRSKEKEKEKEKVLERSRGRARGKRVGATGAAGAERLNATIDDVKKARRVLLSLVSEALDTMREDGGIGPTPEVSKSLKSHIEQRHKDAQPEPCSTTMVVTPSLPSGVSGVNRRRGAMLPNYETKPVLVSGKVSSAWEACVEYVYGIKQLLDRSAHFTSTGDVLGNVEIAAVADLGHAVDSDSSDCDSLVRIVLSGLGVVDASFPKKVDVSDVSLSEHGSCGMELFVRHCKGTCRAIDLILKRELANALILSGPFNNFARMHGGLKFGKRLRQEDDTEAGKDQIEVSGTEVMLRCVESYIRLKHPWLRRMALVNLAGNFCVRYLHESEDFLILNQRTAPLQILTPTDKRAGDRSDASSQNVRACAEPSASSHVHESQQIVGCDPKDGLHPASTSMGTISAFAGSDRKMDGEMHLMSQVSLQASVGHEKSCGQGNSRSGSHTATLESNSCLPSATRSDSTLGAQEGSVDNPDADVGASLVNSVEISVSLREFKPELIFVVYDNGSRHVMDDKSRAASDDRREHDASENLLSVAASIVKDAAEICNGNIVFLEAARSTPSTEAKVEEWLACVRTTTCILESALRAPQGLQAGGSQAHPETASYLPWPMLFDCNVAASGPLDQCVKPVALHGSSTDRLNFNLDDISFETLAGTKLTHSESAKRISRQDNSRNNAASAIERPDNGTNAGNEDELPGAQQPEAGGSSNDGTADKGRDESMQMEMDGLLVNAAVCDKEKASTISDSFTDVPKTVLNDEGKEAARAQKRFRESEPMPGRDGRRSSETPVVAGKQLRAIKPHDAAIEVLRGKPEGLTLDEIVESCQCLPRKLDTGSSRPGTQGMDARGALRHALTAGCSSSGGHLHRRAAAFIKCGDRYQLLHDVSRDTLARAAVHKPVFLRDGDDKQIAKVAVSIEDSDDMERRDVAKNRVRPGKPDVGFEASIDPAGRNIGESRAAGDSGQEEGQGGMHAVDGKISDKLLDLADRIPYNSVRESTAAVWENFRVNTENCTTPAQLARQLVWFSKQILPRVLHSSWAQQSLSGRQSSTLDLWRDRCGRCKDEADVMALLKDFECNAIDWDEVSAAFREEWKASKSRFRSSKHKRVQLSRAEEFALAATTQVPWHASRHMGTRVNFPPVPTCHPPWLGGDGAYPFDAVKG